MKQEYIISTSELESSDVIVIGGGPAGIAASISASRCGKKVTLIEQSGQLGGMATLGNVSIFMPVGNITGIYKEILSEFIPEQLKNANENKFDPHFNPFLYRYYLSQKLEKEKVKVLYHTTFITVLKEENITKGIIVHTREGLMSMIGKIIIDCTGDAAVAINAGAEYITGRSEDDITQPMTLMFQMQNTGQKVDNTLPEGCYYYNEKSDLPQGRTLYWENIREGTLLVNMTRVKGNGSKINELNNAVVESLKQVFSVANYLQRNGFENYIISHIGSQVGVRETNQIKGLYTLNQDDLFMGRRFEDVVAQTNYEIDIHSPDGEKSCDERKIDSYDIPYRCMIPKGEGLENILVAGRAISATHVAMSSLRVQPTCYALGQAAGIAATIAIDHNKGVSEIAIDKLHTMMYKYGVKFN